MNQKPSFKKLLKRRRCLIIADGFYEWKKEDSGKQPFRFQMKTEEPFAFAGLWDRWENNGETLHTCTIITTKANAVVNGIHDRMPVILPKQKEQIWLDRSIEDEAYLKSLLIPFSEDQMEKYPVSSLVNSPKNDTREIVNSL